MDHPENRLTKEDLALQELSALQEVIARHEKHAFAVKALLAAVLTGLATMAFSLKIAMNPIAFFFLGVAAVFGFGLWAGAHKMICSKAIARVTDIEAWLRGGKVEESYVGPDMSNFLRTQRWKHDKPYWLGACGHITNVIPFALAVVMVTAMTIIAHTSNLKPTATDTGALLLSAENVHLELPFGDQTCQLELRKVPSTSSPQWSVERALCRAK